ncbi:methylated-DNA--[protein]-cysteine S-methyltransferase [Verticiella sediminum]|uniref:Methylated-DNA--protein-cysteine methyltransferase n=1 Tax=Verticiella sediminum TaxID=1247510 RepID=A0A556ABG5_9BURK|nr:methylated-DNA--[protein]-cysteine S-methyltransferase [Verticiella sediminum]TSH90234.1 methylated-DNA--[protein]-cysteine S-methyltransferase [Verticiella sediminum]
MPSLKLRLERLPSPLGPMLILTDEDGVLRALDWQDHEQRMHLLLRRQYGGASIEIVEGGAACAAGPRLAAYFAGDIGALDGLRVATGGTAFQRLVWQTLREIPAGTTLSYGELAARIGRAAAVRAVGLANGANPVSLVVPCHRVIGSNRTLTGYGGGLERKRWLLAHEGALAEAGDAPARTARLPGF